MSGTSADGIDAALVSFAEKISLIEYQEIPLPVEIQKKLAVMRSKKDTIPLTKIAELDIQLGRLFADASLRLIKLSRINHDDIIAIGSHGQTVFHSPLSPTPFSLQLGDPNTIALETGITTVADFRNMDISAGGQGAPLTPGFHEALFRKENINRIVLNLGGIANMTLLPGDTDKAVTGFDTGPANALMDEWILEYSGETFDQDGLWGQSGHLIPDLLRSLLDDDFFIAPPPKSTGREYFNSGWLYKKIDGKSYPPEDVQATLQHLTVQSISRAIRQYGQDSEEIIICGGGCHNDHLIKLLIDALPEMTINTTASYGFNPDCIEAMAFAWLANRRLTNLPGNIPSVTGARQPVLLGGIYG